ncbi:hypothetical protein [Chitinimonas sp.]|uniref:hypothetical protein n=1 Tax=Chitinimonas sp. TaxID=1934313 RepID=UPI0035AF862D
MLNPAKLRADDLTEAHRLVEETQAALFTLVLLLADAGRHTDLEANGFYALLKPLDCNLRCALDCLKERDHVTSR